MDFMDFRRKLATDKPFAEEFAKCENVGALIQAAAEKGYFFTADEVRNDTTILPEELANAAGGIDVKNAFHKVYILSPD